MELELYNTVDVHMFRVSDQAIPTAVISISRFAQKQSLNNVPALKGFIFSIQNPFEKFTITQNPLIAIKAVYHGAALILSSISPIKSRNALRKPKSMSINWPISDKK